MWEGYNGSPLGRANLIYLYASFEKEMLKFRVVERMLNRSGLFRQLHANRRESEIRKRSILLYVSSVAILVGGLSYAAVPMYRIFCQSTGYGGEISTQQDKDKVSKMQRKANRTIKVRLNADTASSMAWNFKPQLSEIYVHPGETALVFYTATNPTDVPITGISTYNVVPFEVGQYFNKIQCFCFEEQRLNPHEQVDMPVFFYIDPEFTEDPKMERVDTVTLSYTFFEAKPGFTLAAQR